MNTLLLALQGGMAVGKTTAAGYVAAHAPDVLVLQEDNAAATAAVRAQHLDKTRFEDYIQIQRIYIRALCARLQAVQAAPCILMDLGPEELEFYTLHYPASIGRAWPIETETALAPELATLREVMPQRVLFLEAGTPTLTARKTADATRDRGFFDHNLALLPQKRAWFAAKPTTDFLQTENLTPTETGAAVLTWVRRQMDV